jgi:hypothetical protein
VDILSSSRFLTAGTFNCFSKALALFFISCSVTGLPVLLSMEPTGGCWSIKFCFISALLGFLVSVGGKDAMPCLALLALPIIAEAPAKLNGFCLLLNLQNQPCIFYQSHLEHCCKNNLMLG